MIIKDAIKFFGYPPQNAEFDQYLTSLSVDARPVFDEAPFVRINMPEEGYSFIFDEKLGYEDFMGKSREDGEMIFREIQVYSEYNGSGFERYLGDLPFGLTFETTLAEAKSKFGEPATDHQSGPENWVYVWYDCQGFTLGICFLPDDKGISFLSVEEKALRPPVKW